jgi:hypothetical protein
MLRFIASTKHVFWGLLGSLALAAAPAGAQELESIDPDAAYGEEIDGDLAPAQEPQPATTTYGYAAEPDAEPYGSPSERTETASTELPPVADTADAVAGEPAYQGSETTYGEDDLIGAAEGVFGKGAEGLAKMIQSLLKEQGEPNAFITGREAGGAIGVGLRYGSGTLYHKVEGQRRVYWTGPSIGFDVGANAANSFVLVYNLWDSEELYERYPAGEGQAYVVGGLTASYLRKGDIVIIPIRLGAGLRLGVNAGYMKFSKKQRWLPF